MTYLAPPRSRARRRYAGRSALSGSGFFDTLEQVLTGGIAQAAQELRGSQCSVEAENAMAGFDQQIAQAQVWNPTGYFTPDNVQDIYDATTQVLWSAAQELAEAPNLTDAPQSTHDLITALTQDQASKGLVYLTAISKSRAEGDKAINAPGLKTWVIDTLKAARAALKAAAFHNCNMTWLERASRVVNAAIDVVIAVLRRIAGIVIAAGQAVVSAIDWGFTLLKFAKYGIVIGGAAFVLFKVKQWREAR